MLVTRRSHPLAPIQIETQYSYFQLAAVQWNKLPAEVVVLPTLEQLRVAVRSHDRLMP